MKKTTFLVALAGAACVNSAAAAQATGKIDPKQRAKIQPSDAQQRGKIEPGNPSGLTRRVNLAKGMTATAAEKIYATARLDDIERIVLKAVPEFGLSYPTFTQFDGFHASAPKSNTILVRLHPFRGPRLGALLLDLYGIDQPHSARGRRTLAPGPPRRQARSRRKLCIGRAGTAPGSFV
jgi:hypothetical protein